MILLILLTLGVLTIAGILAIFLLAFYRLWRNPPKVEVSVVMPINLPSAIWLRHQNIPNDLEVRSPLDEPIPEHIIDYIDRESEEHAKVARRKRVRMLRAESGSWETAFRMLQKEDDPN